MSWRTCVVVKQIQSNQPVINSSVRDVSECSKIQINRLQMIEDILDRPVQWFSTLDFRERQVFLNENASLVEDKRFLGMVEQDTIVHDGHYEIWERFFHPTAL